MKHLLLIACTGLIAASAAAQTKITTTPKIPQNGYIAPPPGTQLLVVGGSDNCANAAASDAIAGTGTFAVTNVGATTGTLQPACRTVNSDVFFFWTSSQNGTARVQTCGGTTADSVLAAWVDNNGGACPTGVEVACNDDSCGLQSVITFPATAGQTFFIQVGSYSTTVTYTGTFTVDYLPPPPVNDDCATPIALPAGDGTTPFDTTMATTGTQGQSEAACLDYTQTGLAKDIWYTWTPTMTGTVAVSTCGLMTAPTANADTRIAVYDGAGCPAAAAIACNDDEGHSPTSATYTCTAGNFNSTAIFTALCGQQYTIQIGQYPLNTGNNVGAFSITQFGSPCVVAPGVEYCAGDGLSSPPTTPCPCGNTGGPGNGCASSFNPAGAHITAAGQTALDNVVLTGSGMQATGICVFLQGDAIDPNAFQFGDGITCTGGALIRLRGVALSGGSASFPVPPETITLSQRGGVTIGSGAIRSYTVFYRNAAAAFCPPFTFNAGNSYRITW